MIRKQLVLGLLLLLAIDPFELQESTLATSDLVSDRLGATAYTAPSADRIAVVLVDDDALDDSNAYWPPAFPFWTHLLGKVLQHNPAAVYFDVSFDYPRPSFSTPDDGPPQSDSARAADEAGALAALMTNGTGGKHVPVILGSLGRLAALRAPLAGCANPARNGERTSVIPVLACAAAETDFFDYALPPDGRGYPLWTAWPDGKGFVQSRLPAPAMAALSCQVLYPAPGWCAQGASWLSMPFMLRKPDDVAVIPQWSRYTSDIASPPNPANFAGCTRYPSGSDRERDWNWVKTLASEAFAGPLLRRLSGNFTEIQDTAGTAAEPCPPFPVIPASKLLDLTGKYRQNLTGLLQNRIVLIGDGRRYSPDYVAAPLHQTLPGVISQATVLETLLSWPDEAVQLIEAEPLGVFIKA
jgi:hypothetical protein